MAIAGPVWNAPAQAGELLPGEELAAHARLPGGLLSTRPTAGNRLAERADLRSEGDG
jgi:hypothetical protein